MCTEGIAARAMVTPNEIFIQGEDTDVAEGEHLLDTALQETSLYLKNACELGLSGINKLTVKLNINLASNLE